MRITNGNIHKGELIFQGEKMKELFCISILFLNLPAVAAIQQKTSAAVIAPFLKENTSFIGGQAGRGFSILDVRLSQDLKLKQERLVLDIGDLNGAPLKGKTGFYHVENKGTKIVISFSQMPKTIFDKNKLLQLTKGSLSIGKTYFVEEPDSSTTKLILEFKAKPRIKIFDIKGNQSTAKMILDIYK